MACDGEEDGGLVGRAGEDHLIVASRTQEIGRVKPVRHPQPACASTVSETNRPCQHRRLISLGCMSRIGHIGHRVVHSYVQYTKANTADHVALMLYC